MDRTAMQHAGIAAEAVNGTNQRIRATLTGDDDADLTRLKDAYEVACSIKLLAQRLTLTMTELGQVVGAWHEAGHLHTAPATDVDTVVTDAKTALDSASRTARALFTDLDHATDNLALIGWKDPAPAGKS